MLSMRFLCAERLRVVEKGRGDKDVSSFRGISTVFYRTFLTFLQGKSIIIL